MSTAVDPVLSNRLFLDVLLETVSRDSGAGGITAATATALNGIADGTAIAGLVQPIGPRKLTLTITDANASIDAFSITVVGKDRFGAALTQTFLFAGGLVQVSTDYYAVLTSITVNSITSESAGDSLACTWGVCLPLILPMLDGEYGVTLDDPSREQPHVVGDVDAQYMVFSKRTLAGPLKMGLWPHLWKMMLDYGASRDSSNEVTSAMFRRTFPGIETAEHIGVKCDKMAISGAAEGDIMVNFDLIGWYEKQHAAGALSYPGTGGSDPDHVAYAVPAIPSLEFANCVFVVSLNAGSTFANRIFPKGVDSFDLTLENNLRPGKPVENRFVLEKHGAIEFLVTGRKKLSLKYTATFDRDDFATMQRTRLKTQFKLLGAHPSYTQVATVAADAATGNIVAVQVDSSTNFIVGDVCFLDAAGGTTLPMVATITAIPDGTHITFDTLDENVKTGDHIFNAAIELKTQPAIVPSMPKKTSFGDFVTVDVTGDIFSGGPAPLSYKCRNHALPA